MSWENRNSLSIKARDTDKKLVGYYIIILCLLAKMRGENYIVENNNVCLIWKWRNGGW